MRTKAEILMAKSEFLASELQRVNREIAGLSETPCNLECSGCGKVHATEWDFASHYLIPDERYLNLGGCPEREYNPANGPKVSIHFKISTMLGKG